MATSNEKTRVRWLASSLGSVNRAKYDSRFIEMGVEVQVGAQDLDDCAVLNVNGPVQLVYGIDYVRGPKFQLYEDGYLSNRDIGRQCVTANASDLAGMGATGVGFLAVVRYPSDFPDHEFREVMLGVDEACDAYGLRLLGGDTGSAERLILTGSAVGACLPGRALLRSNARPGDVVAVTRSVGGAGAAVLASSKHIVDKLESEVWVQLLNAWTGLNAQMEVGQALAASGLRVACQDVSDGLRATVNEIAKASNVDVTLDLSAVPLHVGVAEVADVLGKDARDLAISASTDFCLCFTCAPEDMPAIAESLDQLGVTAHVVGECGTGAGVWIVDDNGDRVPAPGVEWNHQKEEIQSIYDGLR